MLAKPVSTFCLSLALPQLKYYQLLQTEYLPQKYKQMEDSLQPAGILKPYHIHPAGISNLRQSLTPSLPSAVRLDKTTVKGDKGQPGPHGGEPDTN